MRLNLPIDDDFHDDRLIAHLELAFFRLVKEHLCNMARINQNVQGRGAEPQGPT